MSKEAKQIAVELTEDERAILQRMDSTRELVLCPQWTERLQSLWKKSLITSRASWEGNLVTVTPLGVAVQELLRKENQWE